MAWGRVKYMMLSSLFRVQLHTVSSPFNFEGGLSFKEHGQFKQMLQLTRLSPLNKCWPMHWHSASLLKLWQYNIFMMLLVQGLGTGRPPQNAANWKCQDCSLFFLCVSVGVFSVTHVKRVSTRKESGRQDIVVI